MRERYNLLRIACGQMMCVSFLPIKSKVNSSDVLPVSHIVTEDRERKREMERRKERKRERGMRYCSFPFVPPVYVLLCIALIFQKVKMRLEE